MISERSENIGAAKHIFPLNSFSLYLHRIFFFWVWRTIACCISDNKEFRKNKEEGWTVDLGVQPGECWRALFFQLGEHNKSQIERSKKGVSEKKV